MSAAITEWSVRICWMKDGVHDSMEITGSSLEDLQRKATLLIAERRPDDDSYWSENLREPAE